jgi:hypothetical protein
MRYTETPMMTCPQTAPSEAKIRIRIPIPPTKAKAKEKRSLKLTGRELLSCRLSVFMHPIVRRQKKMYPPAAKQKATTPTTLSAKLAKT